MADVDGHQEVHRPGGEEEEDTWEDNVPSLAWVASHLAAHYLVGEGPWPYLEEEEQDTTFRMEDKAASA